MQSHMYIGERKDARVGRRWKPLGGKNPCHCLYRPERRSSKESVNSFRGNKHGRLTPAISDLLASADDDSDDLEKRCRKINAPPPPDSTRCSRVCVWRSCVPVTRLRAWLASGLLMFSIRVPARISLSRPTNADLEI